MVRLLFLLSVASLLAGCAAKTTPAADVAPNYGGSRAMEATAAKPPSQAPRAIWGVKPFEEKAGWLGTQTALKEGPWGERMAIAIRRALEARQVEARVVPKEVTPTQLDELFAKGLEYLCEGKLTAVTAANGSATMSVTYILKRKIGEDVRTVQARVLKASTATAAVDEASVTKLIDAAAEQVADAVIADVPADLLAIRG